MLSVHKLPVAGARFSEYATRTDLHGISRSGLRAQVPLILTEAEERGQQWHAFDCGKGLHTPRGAKRIFEHLTELLTELCYAFEQNMHGYASKEGYITVMLDRNGQ